MDRANIILVHTTLILHLLLIQYLHNATLNTAHTLITLTVGLFTMCNTKKMMQFLGMEIVITIICIF